MAWRTVVISNPAGLKIRHDLLIIRQESETSLPLEDIAVLVLESAEISLSAAVLSRLSEHGGTVIVCGPNHMPAVAALPFASHSRLSGIHRLQLSTTLPFRKRCWQNVVKAKICNQARCLRILGRPDADLLAEMADMVASGDSSNVESQAARQYFSRLFRPEFKRGREDAVNSALNYGYAVMRAAVARALAAHGFLLTQGIHHHSELNPFNLADDFLEPLRPVVDLRVGEMEPGLSPAGHLEKEHRQQLAALLGCEVNVEGERQSVLYAVDLMAASFGSACRSGDPRVLKLPELVPLKLHGYE